jgi:nicotinamidase/pyrazinamidase
MDALLLVDIQNDFLPGGALAVPRGDEVVAVANRLMPHIPMVVATQDWHPASHGSFASRHAGKKFGDRITWHDLPQTLWPDHCVQGTHGADLAGELHSGRIVKVFRKGTRTNVDSYSGFFDNARRFDTGLSQWLHAKGIRHLFVLGLATDYCVNATAGDALELGFQVTLVTDGCRGVDLTPGDSAAAIQTLRDRGANLMTSDEVAKQLPVPARKLPSASKPTQAAGADLVKSRLLHQGRFLTMVETMEGWEFVRRTNAPGVVCIAGITPDHQLLLVEQFRPPVGRRVLEFPAGLAGDATGLESESLVDAAQRELMEETGYEAETIRHVFSGPSSAGLTDEVIEFFVADGLTKTAAGGGVDGEDVQEHLIPWSEIDDFLERMRRRDFLVDSRVPTCLYLLRRELGLP